MVATSLAIGLAFQVHLRESGLMQDLERFERPSSRLSAAALARRLGPADADRGPTYRDLADRIHAAVLDGRLAVGTGLPSERELAGGLALSRTTVGAAYALLREQGWLDSRRGSGSRLRLPDGAGTSRPGPAGVGAAGTAIFGYPAVSNDDIIDLTVASLPPPANALRSAVVAATEDLMTHAASDGYHPYGLPELREVIADRFTAAGMPTTVEQVLVTSGAQHAFTLALGEFSAAGDRVLVECPTYPIALDAVRHHRRVSVPVGLAASCDVAPDGTTPIADQPWDLGVIGPALRHSTPRLAYLIPDFHNPTGAVMPWATREALVAAARSAGTLLVVDESFRDISFPGSEPLPPPVAAADTRRGGETVLTLGSVSKSLWGGLRTGWVRGTPAQIRRLAAARALGDMAGPVLDQLVATRLLRDPQDALDVQRARVAAGAQAAQSALARYLPSWRWTTPAGGTSLWVRLPEASATELAALAPAAGVRVVAGPRFGPDGTMGEHLRLPFTAGPDVLAEAVRRLSAVAGQAAERARSSIPDWLA